MLEADTFHNRSMLTVGFVDLSITGPKETPKSKPIPGANASQALCYPVLMAFNPQPRTRMVFQSFGYVEPFQDVAN